jgi:hypothetical protein
MKPHRNYGFFSNYYLDELLPREEEFRVSRLELKETFQAIKSLILVSLCYQKNRQDPLRSSCLRLNLL